MRYYYAGDRGLVGKAYNQLMPGEGGNTDTVDYTNYEQTLQHLRQHNPTHVIINAATVGGLQEDIDKSFWIIAYKLKNPK